MVTRTPRIPPYEAAHRIPDVRPIAVFQASIDPIPGSQSTRQEGGKLLSSVGIGTAPWKAYQPLKEVQYARRALCSAAVPHGARGRRLRLNEVGHTHDPQAGTRPFVSC